MKRRILTNEEITRSKINTIGARVALHAELEKGNFDFKMDHVDDLINYLCKHDLTFENEDEVKLMRSVVMGALHASAVAEAGFEGTAAMSQIIRRMSSSQRPESYKTDEPIYMIEAVTDAVIVEKKRSDGSVDQILVHQLKTDLSNVFSDFHMLRKEAAEKEAAYNLFTDDDLQKGDK